MPQVGWDAYKTINVKYINQIVCEKNIIDSLAVKKPVVLVDSASVTKNIIDSAVKTVIREEVKTAAAVQKEVEKIGVKKVTTINSSKESKSIVTSEPKKATTKETKTGVQVKEEKISAKPDPSLYRPPVKITSEKIKKTDTKKNNNK